MPRKRKVPAKEYFERDMYEDAEEDESGAGKIIDSLMSNPNIQNLVNRGFGALNTKIDELGAGLLARLDRYATAFAAQQAYSQQQQQSAPKIKKDDPRIVLGFGPDIILNKQMIKERHRVLAGIFHTDVGGHNESMLKINAAVEELLEQVKE